MKMGNAMITTVFIKKIVYLNNMKTLKDYLRENAPKFYAYIMKRKRIQRFALIRDNNEVKMWKIRSFTEEDKSYIVRFFKKTREWKCDCPKFIFSKEDCKHIKFIKSFN